MKMPQGFLFLGFSILATAGAHILLKKGMTVAGVPSFSSSGLLGLFFQIFHNIYLFSGLVFLGFSFISWLFVLSRLQLNIAYPIVTGINFLLVNIGSWILFKETLSFAQILGMGFIVFGAFLLLRP